jgi:hypothetical protein
MQRQSPGTEASELRRYQQAADVAYQYAKQKYSDKINKDQQDEQSFGSDRDEQQD